MSVILPQSTFVAMLRTAPRTGWIREHPRESSIRAENCQLHGFFFSQASLSIPPKGHSACCCFFPGPSSHDHHLSSFVRSGPGCLGKFTSHHCGPPTAHKSFSITGPDLSFFITFYDVLLFIRLLIYCLPCLVPVSLCPSHCCRT